MSTIQKDFHATAFVDPHIGSGGHGHVFVGASVTFGALQLSHENIFKGWDWCSGYNYSDSILIGFAHTHLSGTGASDLGDILMPFTGKIVTKRGEQNNIKDAFAAKYTHQDEQMPPGYYSVFIKKYGIKAELGATERVGIHRYTYPSDAKHARVIIDLKEGNGDRSYKTYLKLVLPATLFKTGYKTTVLFGKNNLVCYKYSIIEI